MHERRSATATGRTLRGAIALVVGLGAAFLGAPPARAAHLGGRIASPDSGADLHAPGTPPLGAQVPAGLDSADQEALAWLPVAFVVPRGHRGTVARARVVSTGETLAAECLGSTGYLGYQVALARVARPGARSGTAAGPPSDIEVEIETAPGATPPVVRRRIDPEQGGRERDLVRRLVANPEDVVAYSPPAAASPKSEAHPAAGGPGGFHPSADPALEGSGVRYLIVTTEALQPHFQPLADWKKLRGMPAAIRTMEWIESRTRHGVDRAETLRNFLVEAYALWGIEYVLLGGDTGSLPVRYGWGAIYGGGPVPADLYYACLDGTWNDDGDALWGEVGSTIGPSEADIFPELGVARAPVNDGNEAQTFVSRVIGYEQPLFTDYQARALFLSEVLVPANWDSGTAVSYDGAVGSEQMISQSVPPAFDVQRLYDTYWLYPGASRLTRTATIAAINSGTGIVNHLGHGYRYTMSCGDASFVNPDADALSNGGRRFVLLMANCAAVAFDYNCLAERFLLNQGGGAAGVIGAARSVSASLIVAYNAAFHRQLFEYGHVHLAEVLNHLRLERAALAEVDGNDRWVQFALNALGDPEMTIFTGPVRAPDLQHPATLAVAADTLAVTVRSNALPVAGARLCAAKGEEVYAVGVTDSTGRAWLALAPQTAGELSLTVSGQNLATRTDTLQVLPASGPVLAVGSLVVDEDSTAPSAGNGDGAMDAGETLELWVQVLNRGPVAADSVVGILAAPDPRITVLQDTLAVGTVGPGAEQPGVAPLVVRLGADIPDGKSFDLPLGLRAAGGGRWDARLHLLVSAPQPEVTRIQVTLLPASGAGWPGARTSAPAAAGRRARADLEPTADIAVEVKNYGSGTQPPLTATLVPADSGVVVVRDSMRFAAIAPLGVELGTPTLEVADTTAAPGPPLTLFLRDGYGRTRELNVDLQPPPAPAVPQADLTYAPGCVRLTWPVSTAADHFGYHVFRAGADSGGFVRATPDIIRHADFYDTSVQANSHYEYYVLDVDSSRQWSPPSPTLAVNTTAASIPPWPLDMSDPTASSVGVGDLDGDGEPEIVVGDTGVYAWHANGQELRDGDNLGSTYGVFSPATGSVLSSVALAAIDAAPGLEIVAASWLSNRIYIWNWRGELLPGWPREPASGGNTGYWASPCVGDVDGDGGPEIVTISKDGYLYAWHADGTPLLAGTNGAVRQVGAWTQTTPALADLDGDGKLEIVVSGALARVDVIRWDGTDFPGWPKTLYALGKGSPAIGDVNGDGSLEIVITSESNHLWVFRADGTTLPGWPKIVPGDAPDFGPSPALGDLDGDGRLEIVVCSVKKPFTLTTLYVFDAAGNTLLAKPLELNSQSSPILADLDGDGTIDIVHGGEAGLLHAWTLAGQELAGFPIPVGDWIRCTPQYCDLNRDGTGDLVLAGWNKKLYAWAMTGPYRADRAPWPGFHGDLSRTGHLPRSFPTPASEPPLATHLAARWSPNPFNPSATLRLTVPAGEGASAGTRAAAKSGSPGGSAPARGAGAVDVQVVIFDARGRRVRTLLDEPRFPGRYTLTWDGRDGEGGALPSGVYLYHVRAGTQRATGKLTLLR